MARLKLDHIGLSDEQKEAVDKAFDEKWHELMNTYIPRDRFNEVNETKKANAAKVAELQAAIDATDPKAVEKLQSEIETLKETHAKEINDLKRDHAIETALTGAKAKNIKATKALLDMEQIIDNDGTFDGLDDQIKALTESKDTSFLFDTEPQDSGRWITPDIPDGDDFNAAQESFRKTETIKEGMGLNR